VWLRPGWLAGMGKGHRWVLGPTVAQGSAVVEVPVDALMRVEVSTVLVLLLTLPRMDLLIPRFALQIEPSRGFRYCSDWRQIMQWTTCDATSVTSASSRDTRN
jgi:hypothetical protein